MKTKIPYIILVAVIILLSWIIIGSVSQIIKTQNAKVRILEQEKVENAEAVAKGLLIIEKEQSREARIKDRQRAELLQAEIDEINKINKEREQREYDISVELGLN